MFENCYVRWFLNSLRSYLLGEDHSVHPKSRTSDYFQSGFPARDSGVGRAFLANAMLFAMRLM